MGRLRGNAPPIWRRAARRLASRFRRLVPPARRSRSRRAVTVVAAAPLSRPDSRCRERVLTVDHERTHGRADHQHRHWPDGRPARAVAVPLPWRLCPKRSGVRPRHPAADRTVVVDLVRRLAEPGIPVVLVAARPAPQASDGSCPGPSAASLAGPQMHGSQGIFCGIPRASECPYGQHSGFVGRIAKRAAAGWPDGCRSTWPCDELRGIACRRSANSLGGRSPNSAPGPGVDGAAAALLSSIVWVIGAPGHGVIGRAAPRAGAGWGLPVFPA